MGKIKISSELKYYLYVVLLNLRFTRIINVIFIVKFLKLSLIQFAFLQSVFLCSQLISEVPTGILGDIIKRKKIILFGLCLLTISPLLTLLPLITGQHFSYYILLVVFIVEGIGNAFLSGADDALFFEALRSEGKQEIYGRIRGKMQLVCALALGIATFIGGLLYSIDVCLPYISQSVTVILSMLVILATPENRNLSSENSNKNESHRLKDLFFVFYKVTKSSKILFMVLFTCIIVSAINVIFTFLPEYFSKIGISDSNNGIIFMIFSIFGGIVATQAYKISKVSISKIIQTVSILLLSSILLQIIHYNITLIFSLLLLYIIIDILDPIIMEMLHLWVEDKSRATIISGLSFSISLTTMLMNPIISVGIRVFGTRTVILITSIFIVSMVTISYILIKANRKENKNE